MTIAEDMGERYRWTRCRKSAAEARDTASKALIIMDFLKEFPTGLYNRNATEEIEWLLDELVCPTLRTQLQRQLRDIRDAVMPPVQRDSWNEEIYYRALLTAT